MAFLKGDTYLAPKRTGNGTPGMRIAPSAMAKAEPARHRAPEAVKADLGKAAPRFPETMRQTSDIAGAQAPHIVLRGSRYRKPFLPAMDFKAYAEYKARARAQAPATKPAVAGGAPAAQALGRALAPVNALQYIEGAANADQEAPPDTHGAVGAAEYVEVTNSHITIYDKTNPVNLTSTTLAAFFGYFTQGLFDPRVVYDTTWNRWTVIADAFPESPTVQYLLVAISTTSSAFGSFSVYAVNVTFNAGDFWDFPQLGMDQDAVIFTANVFDSNGNLRGADMFAVAKARLYNGLGFSVPLFTGLVSTLAPSIVLDQNPNTYLIAAPPSGSALQLYALTNSSRPTAMTLAGPVDIAVDPYDMPPPAPQPGLGDQSDNIDTGDSRFVNASTQIGDSLWQTHTVMLSNWAAPKFYQINTSTNSVVQSGFYFASDTSNDFNASIAANANNDVFVTWSSVDSPAGINAQVRFAGSVGVGGASFAPGAGSALVGSNSAVTGDFDPRFGLQRWGDYSAVTIDPANIVQAWLVNEKINDPADWGSGIGVVG